MLGGAQVRSARRATSLRLVAVALAPLAVAVPLRLLFFGDDSSFTLLFLGPATEESVKLACAFLGLSIASLILRGGRDPALALRYWLFLVPWAVGGVYGMFEGVAVYPGEAAWDFTLREAAHGAFTGLALAASLWSWRGDPPSGIGVGFGFLLAWAAHVGFNEIAFVSGFADLTFLDQLLYVIAIVVLALIALAQVVRREPASREARRFLPSPSREPRA